MMNKDVNGTDGCYVVKSLYFDTPSNRDYNDTLKNAFSRHKMRLRTYNDDNSVFHLEQKFKQGGMSTKTTVSLSREEARAVANGDYTSLLGHGEKGAKLFSIMSGDLYLPKLYVKYDRVAYNLDIDNLRVTLDSRIEYGMPRSFITQDKNTLMSSSAKIVLEIKYDTYVPAWLMASMKRCGIVLSTNSKFCQGMRTVYGIE